MGIGAALGSAMTWLGGGTAAATATVAGLSTLGAGLATKALSGSKPQTTGATTSVMSGQQTAPTEREDDVTIGSGGEQSPRGRNRGRRQLMTAQKPQSQPRQNTGSSGLRV